MNKTIYRVMSFIVAIALAFGGNKATLVSASSDALNSTNIYYVGTTGSDTNTGSISAPYKTFAKAVSVLQAGDTLHVMKGTYTETLTLLTSGTAAMPITIIGNGAILNMQGVNQNGITIKGSYINVSGFEVVGAIDFGIYITGRNVTIENNILHDNVTKNGIGTCGISSSWGSGLKVKMGGENTTIRNNTVHDNCGEGIAVTRGVTTLVEGNTVWDNFSVNIYIDNSAFATVQNNISYCTGTHLRDGNRPTGIALGEEYYSGWGAQLHDVLISGNTIRDCRTGIAAYESNVNGILSNVAILNNFIPSGEKRSISIQTVTNQNVLVANNLIFNSIYVFESAGVTLGNNTIGNEVPTATVQPSPTNTPIVSSSTSTSIPPDSTNTAQPTLVSPTATLPVQSATPTSMPASPTYTSTSVPPTATSVSNIPSSAETVFDDRDGNFSYSSGWQDLVMKAAYGGSLKLTSVNGAFVTFPFSGQSFSILYRGGKAYRDVDVYVDDVYVGTINQRSSNSTFQLRWDYAGQLSLGSHVLKLVFNTPSKSGREKASFDAVIVR